MTLVPFEEALDRLLRGAQPVSDVETVAIDGAFGRILAADLHARRTQPAFDASAMDGYALRAADLRATPCELDIVGESAAGHAFDGAMPTGGAVRIFTGAPVPDGADAVVIQENTERVSDRRVRVLEPMAAGANIRRAGNDFAGGDVLLRAGLRLGPAACALAASGGHGALPVRRQVRVAVAATGDELVPPGAMPGPSQTVASNSLAVAMIVRAAGGRVIDLGIVPDLRDALADAFRRARREEADVLVTIGGASVGDHDLVGPVLRDEGAKLDFWKVAMRPGKPLMAGSLGPMHVLGLPGNPASSLVTAELFLRPLVERLSGLPAAARRRKGILGAPVRANDHRCDFLRARLESGEDGGPARVVPLDRQDSSLLTVFARADALLVRPAHASAALAGSECEYVLLSLG
ncbi:molybdopterin molybdenumtransferase MoeA [Aureimonas flava]|uniref:Molybdopterin molybdenumtransferase n=1 Tax=Aureimonas flava TaxID=2320271 RepID=A0A3A1WKA0_9HYPH|nr:gephyrin-like molybdotransferase Glp [Aureimonas flava]RIY01579.1 molybdopterin molybdenumtransferase MoeA [Aureimonas flava]